ncbi:glycerophosphodiester phosphodiesterase [Candidatus Aerophobetes bacterium Ae_b3b]|nr:MAG: glycerophosphodiester phosphodiesterase [Candidatus Aerophobetes bacterium Ae_b3b]
MRQVMGEDLIKKNLPKPMWGNHGSILVISHRGASGRYPENTMAAFRMAVEIKADMIELDVRRSKDGHLVVIHDVKLGRTTNGEGRVRETPLAELKALSAGAWWGEKYAKERIPTLDEVLAWAQDKLPIVIDVKTLGIEEELVKLVEKHQMVNQVVIRSWGKRFLQKLKSLNRALITLSLSNNTNGLEDILGIRYGEITSALVAEAHRKGKLVWVWTVDDKPAMRRYINMGVDGIISNYPAKVIEVLEEHSSAEEPNH